MNPGTLDYKLLFGGDGDVRHWYSLTPLARLDLVYLPKRVFEFADFVSKSGR